MEHKHSQPMIAEDNKKYFPFNYNFIMQRAPIPAEDTNCLISKPISILAVQNENAFFDTFYKSITRF